MDKSPPPSMDVPAAKATYTAKHPAAFINAIYESGTKEEAIEWLQRVYDELVDNTQLLSDIRIQFQAAQVAAKQIILT